jgi:hypothetical protein
MRIWYGVLLLLPVLMAGDVGGGTGGFLAGLAGLAGGIASAIRGWLAITAEQLLRLLNYLKDVIIKLSEQIVIGMFRLGQVVARVVVQLATLAVRGIRDLASWAYTNLKALSGWLREKLGPVLRFIQTLKDHIKAIYDNFVRPVIEVIDFIRQMNTILGLFHITVLQKLDDVLSEIERRIQAPFLFINQKLNELTNAINNIIGLDGLIRRAELIASMVKHAPPWIAGFWNTQVDRDRTAGSDYDRHRSFPEDAPWKPGDELGKFYRGAGSRMDEDIDGLMPTYRIAAGLDPHGPDV